MLTLARIWEKKCYVQLQITNSMTDNEIQDELFEDAGRAFRRISFPVVEIPEEPEGICIRSDQWWRIESATLVKGKLCDLSSLKKPISDSKSQIWHFCGYAYFITGIEVGFCEYDADKREGVMFIYFDGDIIPKLCSKYPQLRNKIRIAKPGQYEWLQNNW